MPEPKSRKPSKQIRATREDSTARRAGGRRTGLRQKTAGENASTATRSAGLRPGGLTGNEKGTPRLTHISDSGDAKMVDVSGKEPLLREAIAAGEIRLAPATIKLITGDQIAKGNVLATARLAGILAAKRTGELIPLCHPLPINHCEVNFEIPASEDRVLITASAKIIATTGVEMEALTAVSVAALTIYDMCKAADKTMEIGSIRLLKKTKTRI